MKHIVFCILFVVCTISAFAIRPEIWSLVDDISTENRLDSDCVGRGCGETKQWRRYIKLSTEATNEELADLTEYTNAVVRCYAFLALVQRQAPEVYPILLRSQKDAEAVDFHVACIPRTMSVGQFCLDVAVDGIRIGKKNYSYKFTAGQRKTIDSLFGVSATTHSQKR